MLTFEPTAEETAELTRILDTIRMTKTTQVWDLQILDPRREHCSFVMLSEIIGGSLLAGLTPLEEGTPTTVTFRDMIRAITPEEDLDLRDDDLLALLEDGHVANATVLQHNRVTANIYAWTTPNDRATVQKFRDSLTKYESHDRLIWFPFRDMLVQALMDEISARLPLDAQW